MGCGESVRMFPMLGTVFGVVLNRSPCGSPASVNMGVTNGYVVSSRTYYRTSGRRVMEHCCATLYGGGGNIRATRRRIHHLRLLVGGTNVSASCEGIMSTTLTGTRRANGPTATVRLPSNGVVANGADSLLNTSTTLLLGTLGRLTNVTSSVLLVSPIMVRPVRGLGMGRLNGRGPELRASRILLTLSVYTTAGPATRLTLRRLGHLGDYRMRSDMVLTDISVSAFGGLNVGMAYRPECRAGGLCRKWGAEIAQGNNSFLVGGGGYNVPLLREIIPCSWDWKNSACKSYFQKCLIPQGPRDYYHRVVPRCFRTRGVATPISVRQLFLCG